MAQLAALGPILTVGSAVIGAGATIYSAYSTYQQGVAAQAEYERQAKIDELHGKNEFAASQREADLRRLEGNLILSRQQAAAAASGAGSGFDDPTMVKIMSQTGARSEYGAESVLYQGASRQDDYLNLAETKRISGRNNYFGSILRAVGVVAGGIGDLAGTSDKWIPAATRLAGG